MVIETGVNGILIPVADEGALYEAMIQIVEDSELASSLSLNALKVNDEYSLQKITKQWECLLD